MLVYYKFLFVLKKKNRGKQRKEVTLQLYNITKVAWIDIYNKNNEKICKTHVCTTSIHTYKKYLLLGEGNQENFKK